MKFSIGAKVVHPAYGPGQVVAIKDQQFVENYKQYYVIRIPAKKLLVMVPTERAENIGLRPVSDLQTLDEVWEILQGEGHDLSADWKLRKERISGNLLAGDVREVARDLRDLAWKERERKLSYTDKKLLDESRNLLAGELALAKDIGLDEALQRLDSHMSETIAS